MTHQPHWPAGQPSRPPNPPPAWPPTQPGNDMPSAFPPPPGIPDGQSPDGHWHVEAPPPQAPGPVVAGALVFAFIFGGYCVLVGLGVGAYGVTSNPTTSVVVLAAGAAGFIGAVVLAWFLWRGKPWALGAAIVLSVGLLAASFAVIFATARPEAAAQAVACPFLILVLLVSLLVVPQTSRHWFFER